MAKPSNVQAAAHSPNISTWIPQTVQLTMQPMSGNSFVFAEPHVGIHVYNELGNTKRSVATLSQQTSSHDERCCVIPSPILPLFSAPSIAGSAVWGWQ